MWSRTGRDGPAAARPAPRRAPCHAGRRDGPRRRMSRHSPGRPPIRAQRALLRSGPRSRAAVCRRAACGIVPRLQDVRGRPPAHGTVGDRRALCRRARQHGVRSAGVRGPVFPAAATDGGRLPNRHHAHHGSAHRGALAGAHPPGRHARPALLPHPAAQPVRGARGSLPRGLLLGFVLHHARPRRERPDRSRAGHARQLRLSDPQLRPHSQRQPHLLPEPQPAALLRRHGRPVRARHRHGAGAALPARARSGARLLDGWRRAAGARHGVPSRGAPAERRAAQSLLGRPRRAQAGVLPAGFRAGADGPAGAARGAVPQHPRDGRKRVGFFQPLAARSRRPAHAGDDAARAGGPQQPAVRRRAHDRRPAPIPGPSGRRRRGRAVRARGRGAAARAARGRVRSGQRVLLRRPLAHRAAGDRSPHAGGRCTALLRARHARAGPGGRRAPRARLPAARRVRHDRVRFRAAVGRAQRLAAARVARHPGRAPLRPWPSRRHRRRPLARAQPPHLPRDGQDGGEVRRGGRHPARRRRRVSHTGWLRLDQRGRAGARRQPTTRRRAATVARS